MFSTSGACVAQAREGLLHRQVGGQRDELGGHHAAGGVRRVGEQLAHVLRLLDLHLVQQRGRGLLRQLTEQVGGFVGRHLFEDVGGIFLRHGFEQLRLDARIVDLGERVGGGFRIERAEHRWRVRACRDR